MFGADLGRLAMARLFELSTHVKTVSRGEKRDGAGNVIRRSRSATAAAAYRACCVIEDEREGRTHDYSRKQGLEHAEIMLPKDAASWARDRATLWNAAELAERNKDKRAKQAEKANATTAREFLFSFPAELSKEGRLRAARRIAAHVVEAHEVAADFAIHEPGREGDERNFHCHMLMTTRRVGAKGLGAKTREWDDRKSGPKLAKELRAFIAATLNDELKAEGKDAAVYVEHRSFKDRGSAQTATVHQGASRTNQLRKQQGMARRAWLQRQREAQRERQAKELAGLKLRQDFGLKTTQAELQERRNREARQIRRDLEAARAADPPPRGWRRALLLVSGKAMREASERQDRDAARVMDTKAKLNALKAELARDMRAYTAAQLRDREALTGRHASETGQLREAVTDRERMDRAMEVSTRQEQAQSHARQERTHTHEQGLFRPPDMTLH
jgi:hypothetical protein